MKKKALVEQFLRRSVPQTGMPPGLHGSIMRAVQTSGPPLPAERKASLGSWVPVLAVVALIGTVWAWHLGLRPAPTPSAFERAGTALATSREMARAVPATALAPLNEEWRRLNQDLDNTAQFLLASLP